jgi:hypothetical protein
MQQLLHNQVQCSLLVPAAAGRTAGQEDQQLVCYSIGTQEHKHVWNIAAQLYAKLHVVVMALASIAKYRATDEQKDTHKT